MNLVRVFWATAILHVLCIGLPVKADAQGGVPLWTNRFVGPGNSSDGAIAVVVAPNGDVIVTGSCRGSGTLSSDFVTIAYCNSGMPLWTNYYGKVSNREDFPTAMAVDADGTVFVTGSSAAFVSEDFATVAYSSTGIPLWTNHYDGGENRSDRPFAIAVDVSGNVFVTGSSAGNPYYHVSTLKYSGDGTPLWTNRWRASNPAGINITPQNDILVSAQSFVDGKTGFGSLSYSNSGESFCTNFSSGDDDRTYYPKASAVGSNGNLYIAGYTSAPNGIDYGFVTAAFSSTGVALWTNRYDPTTGDDRAAAVAVSPMGTVYVTGWEKTTNTLHCVTFAYASNGVPIWTNRYGVPGNLAIPKAITLDQSGNVLITGYSGGDCLTLAYSEAGLPLWTNRYNGDLSGFDQGQAIAIDSSGNIFVTGGESGTSLYDFVTIKYSAITPSIAYLNFQRLGNQLVLSWTNAGFGLQSAPTVTGAFTNVVGTTSPYTNSLTSSQKYFRLKRTE